MCFVADARGDVTPYSTGHWGAPMSVDKAPVTALSCLSAGRCVAGDRIGDILSSQSGKWTAPSTTGNGGARITAISCTRGLFCAAVDAAGDALVGAGHPGYPRAQVQFPSGSGTQADLTAGAYASRAGSTGSGTVVLSGKSGSLTLEMTPYPHTATPSSEHVEGRWQCP
jgi:hypothetical protein